MNGASHGNPVPRTDETRTTRLTVHLSRIPRFNGSPSRLAWWTVAAAALLLIQTGCRPPADANTQSLRSDIFSNVKILGARGTALGQFNKPRSLAVDREDNLYVVDLTGRVQKFTPGGSFMLSWQMPETDLGKPKGMAGDQHGNIIVVEPHYARVNHHSPDGTLVSQWGERGTNAGQFTVPRDVAVGTNGDLFVCEYSYRERIQVFDGATLAFKFGFGEAGSANGQFNRPEGLTVDQQGRLLVADSCNHRVQVFTPQGEWLQTFGKPGSGPGEMSYPYDVVVDHHDQIYVCEFGNSRIQIFDAQGQSREIIGGIGAAPGQFFNPWTLALDSHENLYVADGGNHRVQILMRRAGHSELTHPEPTMTRPASFGCREAFNSFLAVSWPINQLKPW